MSDKDEVKEVIKLMFRYAQLNPRVQERIEILIDVVASPSVAERWKIISEGFFQEACNTSFSEDASVYRVMGGFCLVYSEVLACAEKEANFRSKAITGMS